MRIERGRYAGFWVLVIGLFWLGPVSVDAQVLALDEPAAAAEARPAVALDAPLIVHFWAGVVDDDDPGSSGGPLAIELVRQSILLAARDELGLRTLDPALGEPGQGAGVTAIGLDLRLVFYKTTQLKLTAADGVILDESIPTNWRGYKDLIEALQKHEVLSRSTYVEALGKAGLEGRANTWHDTAEVPAEIRALVDEMSLIPQYRAARALHALIAEDGESPERLAVLSQAYANLGQECQWYLGCEYAVFYARSLLYAQRLKVKAPWNPLGDVSLAYAWLMSGYPSWAQPHLKTLEPQIDEHIEAGDGDPDWAARVRLIRACFEYDMDAIATAMDAGGPEAQIAALWNVKAVEFCDLMGLTFRAIERSQEVNPMSLRIAYPAYEAMGVSTGHRYTEMLPRLFGAVTALQMDQIDDLPPGIARALGRIGGEPLSLADSARLGRVLIDQSAAGGDPAELSYAVLGTLIGQANALHVLYRAKFMRNLWGVDTSAYLREALPAIESHPYMPLIATFLYTSNTKNQGMTRLMAGFEPTYLNPYHVSAFIWHLPDGPVFANGQDEDWLWNVGRNMENQEGGAWLVNMRWFNGQHIAERGDSARRMNGYDPHNPQRAALFLRYSDLPEARFNKQVARYGHHAVVADALADRLEEAGDIGGAREYAELAAAIAPEFKTLVRQARLELLLGNEDRWLAAMLSVLDQPDNGLGHSSVNRLIAHTYMNQGRYEAALPYAQASSRSWAYWALGTYMICLELNGRPEEAERYARAIDERYPNASRSAWLNHRLWTGRADDDAVIALADRIAVPRNDGDPKLVLTAKCWARISGGRFAACLGLLNAQVDQVPFTVWQNVRGLLLARQMQDAERTRFYAERVKEAVREDRTGDAFVPIAALLEQAIEKNQLDAQTVRDWQARHPDVPSQTLALYAGWTAHAIGNDELSQQLLLDVARQADFKDDYVFVARALLRDIGVTNDQMRPTGFAPAHALPPADAGQQ